VNTHLERKTIMPRHKSESHRKAVTKPISLYPQQVNHARERAKQAGSISRYFQLLAEYDKRHNILSAALEEGMTPA
jgi:hypothetical protein